MRWSGIKQLHSDCVFSAAVPVPVIPACSWAQSWIYCRTSDEQDIQRVLLLVWKALIVTECNSCLSMNCMRLCLTDKENDVSLLAIEVMENDFHDFAKGAALRLYCPLHWSGIDLRKPLTGRHALPEEEDLGWIDHSWTDRHSWPDLVKILRQTPDCDSALVWRRSILN
ncbi:hypothetical protein TrispH2_001866 [Trichoplax sp. H2]|nr:hypothetical protein TrispH2_001866 [Trichoplax sp. H2]|eukprot:RDD45896.1 hypothetical protein TrispH2_001866 [Trichoplax sp. H2]